jgi:hypothetical protein
LALSGETILDLSDVAPGARFGSGLAMQGQVAVVGAPNDDGVVADAGAVYVYSDVTTGEKVRLTASDGALNDRFGSSVAIDGNRIVVGAPGHDAAGLNRGAVYVFRLDGETWVQEAKLLPPAGRTLSFGLAVDVSVDPSGAKILVGTPVQDSLGGTVNGGTGRGYFFRFDGAAWLANGVVGSGGDSLTQADSFGMSVAIDGNTAVVGASRFFRIYTDTGTSWRLTQSPWGAGPAVALEGDTLVAGSPTNPQRGTNAGAVFVYANTPLGWSKRAELLPPTSMPGANFGSSVGISSGRIVVGAPNAKAPGDREQAGAAFVFKQQDYITWTLEAHLYASDGAAGDHLGRVVAISGDKVLAWAPDSDTWGTNEGAVYLYCFPWPLGPDADDDEGPPPGRGPNAGSVELTSAEDEELPPGRRKRTA